MQFKNKPEQIKPKIKKCFKRKISLSLYYKKNYPDNKKLKWDFYSKIHPIRGSRAPQGRELLLKNSYVEWDVIWMKDEVVENEEYQYKMDR